MTAKILFNGETLTKDALGERSTADLLKLFNAATGRAPTKFASRAKGIEQTWKALVAAGQPAPAPSVANNGGEAGKEPGGRPGAVLALLRGGPQEVATMATTLGVTQGQVRGAIDNLRHRGFAIRNTGRGVFGLDG